MRGQIVSIKVNFNDSVWKDLAKELPAYSDRVLKKAAQKAQSFWMSEAGRRLDTSREKYTEAIQFAPYYNNYKVFLKHPNAKINGFLARLENGTGGSQIDMKPKLLRGRQYAIIPLWKESGSQPVVFRTVSVNSAPDSWLWPKNPNSIVMSGAKIGDAVIKELDNSILAAIIEEEML